jgi:hypothetical protein
VIISWGITCVIFNLGGTRASVAFFDAFDVELGTLSSAQRKFVRVEKAGTHVSNFDWRRPNVWSMPEYQIQTVSQSAKDTGRFLKRFFLRVVIPNCILRGIAEPRAPSFFETLVQDNLRARYVQDISSFEYSARVEELAGFYHDQRWMHMHHVLRSQGISFQELGHRGLEANVAILLAEEGFSREEALRAIGKRLRKGALASLEAKGYTGEGGTRSASTELAHRCRKGALASLEAKGYTGEGGTRSASTELAHRCRKGALASIERQGFTGEDGTRSASTEFAHRGGEARSAIYRRSGNCIVEGCKKAIRSGEFCGNHQPPKPEKSDKCRVCERVFKVNEKGVRGGVCRPCYQKPEAKAARKKATAEKIDTRGTCSTPGCGRVNDRGREKCRWCLSHRKSK